MAIVGCGVIGASWAARFALSGVEVAVSDPSPEAGRVVAEVLENATAAWRQLGLATDRSAPITIADSVAAAVEGAELVQESVPERPHLKAAVFEAIEAAAPSDAIVASSTSGLRPTELQKAIAKFEVADRQHPRRQLYSRAY